MEAVHELFGLELGECARFDGETLTSPWSSVDEEGWAPDVMLSVGGANHSLDFADPYHTVLVEDRDALGEEGDPVVLQVEQNEHTPSLDIGLISLFSQFEVTTPEVGGTTAPFHHGSRDLTVE